MALSSYGLENTIQFIKAKQWTHYFKKVAREREREGEAEREGSDTLNWLLMERHSHRAVEI